MKPTKHSRWLVGSICIAMAMTITMCDSMDVRESWEETVAYEGPPASDEVDVLAKNNRVHCIEDDDETYSVKPCGVNSDWINAMIDGYPGLYYHDIMKDPGETNEEALIDLAQAILGTPGSNLNEVFDHSMTVEQDGEIWEGNMFNTGTNFRVRLKAKFHFYRNDEVRDPDDLMTIYPVCGGMEDQVTVYSQNAGILVNWPKSQDKDPTCNGPTETGDSSPVIMNGDWGMNLNSHNQGGFVRARFRAQWGELRIGSESLGSQSIPDIEEVTYRAFSRASVDATPRNARIDGATFNDKDQIGLQGSHTFTADENFYLWISQVGGGGWYKVNQSASRSVTFNTVAIPRSGAMVSTSGKEFIRFELRD